MYEITEILNGNAKVTRQNDLPIFNKNYCFEQINREVKKIFLSFSLLDEPSLRAVFMNII